MAAFGLSDKSLETLRRILSSCPAVEKALIYGSRAKGQHKHGSDIDITLLGQDALLTLASGKVQTRAAGQDITLRADDFDAFFAERSDRLLNLIENATGKSIARDAPKCQLKTHHDRSE